MKIKTVVVNSNSKQDSLFLAIILFIIGVILFTNPEGIVKIVSYILGSILILLGVIKLFVYRIFVKQTGNVNGELFKGLFYLIAGCVFIFFFRAIETTLRLIVAIYILYMGINRLMFAISLKKINVNMIPALVFSAVMILFASLLAFFTGLPFKIVGLFIIGYSIIEMVSYVMYSGKKEKADGINEAVIVSEVDEKEEENKANLLTKD